MYETQTYEAIFQRMLSKLSNDIDKREGSIAYDALAPKAAELAIAYMELDNILKFGYVDTTYGKFLDSKVLEVGIIRDPEKKATGTLKFMGASGTVIPKGTEAYTDSGVSFVTTEPGTIVGGEVIVNIVAVNAGVIGNVAMNSIINTVIEDVTCTNIAATAGGEDIETDESLLKKFIKQVTTPSTSGNIYDYYDWALEVVGIGDARVIPIWNGNGTVKVVVIGDDKKAVTPSKVVEVKDYIETKRPVGVNLTVESAVNKSININVKLSLNGKTPAEITPILTEKVEEYFRDVSFIDSEIKISRIGSILLEIPGVVDYSNLTLNASSGNIVLADNEVATIGTVTIT
jgi:uncharacterized phage protein gp47/JayE